jgi:hypothetical protein
MKTLRDTNNNNSNPTQQHFSSNTSTTTTRHNFITSNESVHQNSTITDSESTSYPSLLNQNHRLQSQTIWRANNGIAQFSKSLSRLSC